MDQKTESYLKSKIKDVKDFPKPGIVFKDITTLLSDTEALKTAIDEMIDYCEGKKLDVITGIESRGFIFASIIAHELGKPFVPIRKAGKLPGNVVSQKYDLEYGTSEIEVHKDSISKGQNILIIDDLLATGGTALAACHLVEKLGAKTSLLFLIELEDLGGAQKLKDYEFHSILKY